MAALVVEAMRDQHDAVATALGANVWGGHEAGVPQPAERVVVKPPNRRPDAFKVERRIGRHSESSSDDGGSFTTVGRGSVAPPRTL